MSPEDVAMWRRVALDCRAEESIDGVLELAKALEAAHAREAKILDLVRLYGDELLIELVLRVIK